MLTPSNLLTVLIDHGVPINKGIILDFLPSDDLLIQLSERFKREFAIMFTIKQDSYFLYAGSSSAISLPILLYGGKIEILLKHTHPLGTPHPSNADIKWLIEARLVGSPQVQSTILPLGKKRITFNIDTPSSESIKELNGAT